MDHQHFALFGKAIRHAVEFKNGVTVRLQDLEEGQSVEVLTLSSKKAGEETFITAHGWFDARA